MKINRTFFAFRAGFAAFCLFCAISLICAASAFADETTSEPLSLDAADWPKDGFPLLERRDGATLAEIWRELESAQKTEPFADAVDLQLRRQGPSYRGKPLAVRGRLLRGVYVPSKNADGGDGGWFDLWILLPDSKRDPIRLLTRRAPDGFVADSRLENAAPYPRDVEYRRETVAALAVYYRTTAFNAGDDFFAAPTLVALDFSLESEKTANGVNGEKSESETAPRSNWSAVKWGVIFGLGVGWLVVRRLVSRRRPPRFPKKAKKTPRNADLPDSIEPFLTVALVAGTLFAPPVFADEPADFWPDALGKSPEIWRRETTELRPKIAADAATERRELAVLAFDRLARLVSPAVLTERFGAAPLGDYVATAPEKRAAFSPNPPIRPFCGTLRAVETITLTEPEARRLGIDAIFRSVVELDALENAGKIAVYSPNFPQFNAPPTFFDADSPRRAANERQSAPGIGERVAFLAVPFGRENAENAEIPAALTPRLGWFPTDSPLGRRGVDLSTFEAVPVFPPRTLQTAKNADVRRAAARSLRWTLADRTPFYETLAAVRRKNVAPNENRPENEIVADLFNRPSENQGRAVRLRGRVRRANMILVDDADVRAATGIDRYWQLYVFTNDSQGWPFVLCVPELPSEMKSGGGKDYWVEIEFSGAFYKTWAYKTSKIAENASDADPGENPNLWASVPLLIGGVDKVYPTEEPGPPAPVAPSVLFGAFGVLAVAWIFLRRIANRRRD